MTKRRVPPALAVQLQPGQAVALVDSALEVADQLLEVIVEGWPTGLAAGPTLMLIHDGLAAGADEACEYQLPTSSTGTIQAILRIAGGTLRGAYMLAPDGASVSVDRVSIRSLPAAVLIGRAFRKQPLAAAAAFYWRCAGKKVRARNRFQRILSQNNGLNYSAWLAERQRHWDREVSALAAASGAQSPPPHITVVASAPPDGAPAARRANAAPQPAYPSWSMLQIVAADDEPQGTVSADVLAPGAGAPQSVARAQDLADAVARADGDWVFILRDGDRLAPNALWHLAAAVRDHGDAVIVYGDHFIEQPGLGLRGPALTPEWNEAYYLAYDYIGAVAVRRSDLQTASEAVAAERDRDGDFLLDRLVLQLARGASNDGSVERRGGNIGRVVRTPRLLTLRCPLATSNRLAPERQARRCHALGSLLDLTRQTVRLDARGWPRVDYALGEPAPLVSIIVPTRDRVDLLKPCIEGLRHRTAYPSIEIIIADNNSSDAATLAYMGSLADDARVKVCAIPGPFNYSAINNTAVRMSQGRLLAFLNNDIEVIEPQWLREMAAPALNETIGAVGARLLYPSGLIQHAGVVVGINGLAGHSHRFFDRNHPGYMQRLQVAHYVSAVTAACLVVERSKFDAVGGFDEVAFPVALNDVDLCLKLNGMGLHNLWTPYATLLHKESASRARDMSRQRRAAYSKETQAFMTKWQHVIASDPCYHPELTDRDEDFSLRVPEEPSGTGSDAS